MFDVITIGTATRDVFLRSQLFGTFKDEAHLKEAGFPTGEAQCFALGAKMEIEKPVFTTGGGAANAAVTFARQGFHVASFIKVGNDKPGGDIVKELEKEKIKVFAAGDKVRGTAYGTILLSPNGERTVLIYHGASDGLKVGDVLKTGLRARWAYITPGNIPMPVMSRIIDVLHRNGTLVVMDPSKFYLKNRKHLEPMLKKLAIVKMNREEAGYLTGMDYQNEKAAFARFDELTPGIAVMTDGSRGVTVSDGRHLYKAGIFNEKKLVDRTGAGDAFGSGFVAGLMRRIKNPKSVKDYLSEDIEFAIRVGSANATSVVEFVGAKEGILKKSGLKSARWAELPIRVKRLR